MKKIIKQFLTSLLVVSTLAISQVALLAPASAVEGEAVDIYLWVGTVEDSFMQGDLFQNNSWIQVCANGTGSLNSIDFDYSVTGFNPTGFFVQDRNEWNTATDLGTVDANGDWTGLIEAGQCLTIGHEGTVNGEIGTNLEYGVSIVSSTQADDTVNVDPNLDDNSRSISLPIVDPVYYTNLTPYLGDSGYTYPTVWDGFVPQYQWMNVCSWGLGTVKSFQLDVTTENWINVSFEIDTSPWTNADVTDPGSISPGGLWTGQLQAGVCLNIRAYGEVSGEIGQDAVWTATVRDAVFTDDSLNVDPSPQDDTATLVQPIGEPVYSLNLSTYVGNNNAEFALGGQFQNTWIHICSSGYGSVESMTFDLTEQNWTMETIEVEPYASEYNSATDLGSISMDGEWTGTLVAGQCVVFHAYGPITGDIGDTVSWSATMTSSTLTGGEPNVDSTSGDNSMTISAPVAETGDLAIQTRLMTSGEITDGSTVSYEVEIQNVGAGTISDSTIGLYYVMPDGASLIGITDLDTEDELSPLGCFSMGLVSEIAPAFSEYDGEVIQCGLQGPETGITPGSSYPFQLDLTAEAGFSSGDTEVYGVVLSGNIQEPDSATFVQEFSAGRDGFRLNINNIMHLVYDNNELQVTINRCEGLSENVSEDDACFTVEFNKPVWAASFEVSDLVLNGGGTVYSFVQNSATKWTVRINGMTPGGTLQLLLGAASVSDYSAVSNGVEVLGENIIRYSDGSGEPATSDDSAAGSSSNSSSSSESSATGNSPSNLISAGIDSGVVPTATADPSPLLGVTSGLVAEIPKLFSVDFSKSLLLGKYSLTQNNVLDFAVILVNFAGLIALMIVALDRKKQLI